jgi:hypothetical protein
MANWIQKAIKRPGSLTAWFKRHRSELKRKLGYDPITKRGDIRDKAINDTIKLMKQGKIRKNTRVLRKLYLAKTLKKLRRRK